MKTLVLGRHAKADYPPDVSDFDRPLKERGIKDAHHLGKLLANQDFQPDLIVSSGANRALTTAKIIAKELDYNGDIEVDNRIYSASVGELIEIIEQLPDNVETVMIFGHNNTMSDTVRFLTQLHTFFEMPTSGMVCLENPMNNWRFSNKYAARLRWVLVPRLMRKNGES